MGLPAEGLERSRVNGVLARNDAPSRARVPRGCIAPALLVLDEPTAGLDPPGTEEILALLDRAQGAMGGATLISTHDRVTAVGACDRAVVLVARDAWRSRGRSSALLADDDGPSLVELIRRAEAAVGGSGG